MACSSVSSLASLGEGSLGWGGELLALADQDSVALQLCRLGCVGSRVTGHLQGSVEPCERARPRFAKGDPGQSTCCLQTTRVDAVQPK